MIGIVTLAHRHTIYQYRITLRAYIYIHTYIHTYTHTYIHTYIHTVVGSYTGCSVHSDESGKPGKGILGSLNRAKRRSGKCKVVGSIPGAGMSGGGRRQPCVKGIFSGEIAK